MATEDVPKLSNLIVPLKLDAFVFNSGVCDGGPEDAKIAPITQPNYTFLRIDEFVAQNDVLNHVDLHKTTPPRYNSRFTNLGTRETRHERVGVYIHWMIPRAYRAGAAATNSVPGQPPAEGNADNTAPVFRAVPTRWLVIRTLDKDYLLKEAVIPEMQGWIVESDRLHDIDDLGSKVDLQVDVSPYVVGTENINTQAEVFIGWKEDALGWTEKLDIPRVRPLNVLSSSNPLFADYQPHNSNVFSMVDNFACTLGGVKSYLTHATASYFVVGWHSIGEQDLMAAPAAPAPRSKLQDRLNACLMEFDPTAPDVGDWLNSTEPAQVLCHGAMYDVVWDIKDKPVKLPADILSHHINEKLPVAMGTTPLDSLLAFIQAHKDTDPTDIKKLEEDLIAIQALLIAQDDGVDAQREAVDMLTNQNYERIDGGTHFFFSSTDDEKKPAKPSDDDINALANLNRMRLAVDTQERTVRRLRWDMFAMWWKYISNIENQQHGQDGSIHKDVTDLTDKLNGLIASIEQLKLDADVVEKGLPQAEPGVLPSAYQQRDPTLLVGGIQAGWPHDFLKNLRVRLRTHIIPGDRARITEAWDDFLEAVIPKLPAGLQDSAKDLVNEFLVLGPAGRLEKAPAGKLLPLYHDKDKTTEEAWRDTWCGQPWFPLFLEWEAEYTHIPFNLWSLEEQTSRQSTERKLRYGIPEGTNLKGLADQRTVSGRVLILPQPNFSLQSRLDQLFDATPKAILDKYLSKDDRVQLQEGLYKLSFVSAPLAGFTDHLLTRVQGSHIKPNTRPPGEKPQPIGEVITVGRDVGFTDKQLDLIGRESDLTPYGTLVQTPKEYCAFKPVTHGQMRFTKLNIFDKFGQAIHAIDPSIAARSPPIYPCVSEFYACQSMQGQPGVANTVSTLPDEPGLCEFIQLPPQINQFSRLNSAFVMKTTRGGEEYWKPMDEWENPVWGWVVINYAEHGIQLFLPDGTFYRAVRAGGRGGATASPTWLPFGRPTHDTGDLKQLDRLVEELGDPDYLQGFVDMINEASRNGPAAPSAYAQFLSSVVGKPLALVNMGWSLELAVDAYTNQSTLDKNTPERPLLSGYDFPIKFGDKDRVFDGLVGYFNKSRKPDKEGDLDLSHIFTYSKVKPPAKSPLTIIEKDNYPRFKPFWVNPEKNTADNIAAAHNQRLQIFGALIDPFTPVHGYSSFLPTQALKLPPWTWHSALSKMTAFFHMGPMMVTEGIPMYDKDFKLESNYDLKKIKPPIATVPIPALGLADWNWLQPYIDTTDETEKDGRVFMALGLGKLDNRPRFEKSPYSAIEGYLQLKRPLEPEKSEAPATVA